jgi:hypothetical protein
MSRKCTKIKKRKRKERIQRQEERNEERRKNSRKGKLRGKKRMRDGRHQKKRGKYHIENTEEEPPGHAKE